MKFAIPGSGRSLRNSPGRWLTPWFRMTPPAQTIWAIYCVAAFAYTMYSATTESGLDAYLIRLELDIIGAAEQTLTALLTFGILLAPLWAITKAVGRLAPSLVWASADTSNQSEAGLRKPGFMDRLNRPVQNVSWTVVLVATGIPILVGAVLFPVIYYSGQRDRQEKVYAIDLTSGIADLPKNAKFADVKGRMEQSYRLTFKHTFNTTVSHELFAPITGSGWTPADPIRYFVRDLSYEDGQGRKEWPEEFRKSGIVQFSGKISRSLPAFVEREYQSKGLKLAASYSVIEWNHLPDRDGSSPSTDAELVSGFCLFIGVCMFLMMTIVRVMVPRMRQKHRAAG